MVAVNGCCYGKDNSPDKLSYLKLCGQRFWNFISGDKELYKNLVEPLGYKAKERNDEFFESYAQIINRFTREFGNDFFIKGKDKIDWEKLVEFNSAMIGNKTDF